MKNFAVFLLLVAVFIITAESSSADEIRLRNGLSVKGIVVEDHYDRVVLSTPKGEVSLLKARIERIVYDRPDKNLVMLGDMYVDNNDFGTALQYYAKAKELVPDSKEAQERFLLAQASLFKEAKFRALESVSGSAALLDWDEFLDSQKNVRGHLSEEEKQLVAERIGMQIENTGDGRVMVVDVLIGSPVDKAGINKGDIVISAWGRSLRYMPAEEVAKMLSGSRNREINLDISRHINITKDNPRILKFPKFMVGASFKYVISGLTVSGVETGGPAHNAGLLEGDYIERIDGEQTRYMPIKKFYKTLAAAKDDVGLTIRREVTVWGKD
ncbi:MAG: PDZ domain-containing protein [Candidatus Omnitrophica bacterium]|nr:PDZ domain-containing protein [Candidatus Omnitrophota bacterium]